MQELFKRQRRLNMTLTELERRSGVDRGSIRTWKRGAQPRLGNFIAVCNAVGLDVRVVDMAGSHGEGAIPLC